MSVVVYRMLNISHLIPDNIRLTKAIDMVLIFFRGKWRWDGIPSTVTSDRDPRFTSTIWKGIVDTPRLKYKMSSLFFLQSDGRIEPLHQTLERYLRNYSYYAQDISKKMLPISESACINSLHFTITMTTFFANYGYQPGTNCPTAVP